jgi:trehalose-phosphatase
MKVLSDRFDPPAFWRRVESAGHRLLLLDYDGTLAPFREERDQALPYPGVKEELVRLAEQAAGRVVVISGRPARDVAALLDLEPRPEIWGSHGGERLGADGAYWLQSAAGGLEPELEDAAGRLAELAGGRRVERKPLSVALHWRGLAPERARDLERRARAELEDAAAVREGRLRLAGFDGGLELRPPGVTKAAAVETLLAETPEPRAVAYLGDDLTDEDAFRALAGRGLAVLVRSEPRPTAADWRLAPPAELLDFLERWRRGSRGGPQAPPRRGA